MSNRLQIRAARGQEHKSGLRPRGAQKPSRTAEGQSSGSDPRNKPGRPTETVKIQREPSDQQPCRSGNTRRAGYNQASAQQSFVNRDTARRGQQMVCGWPRRTQGDNRGDSILVSLPC
ncbi:hypothetical protein NDU88_001493 [Pleurodeles waltl]|uniref:Uncharacterized protein n=1 Tax=Pleurodeles waltl TaxID=8319 RepID=A0AAV7PCP6_PLEWA|nr:hypothetical protein NDU88_001493 [Pleurodeles waltl]